MVHTTINPIPVPPKKAYHTKHAYIPQHQQPKSVPVFDTKWQINECTPANIQLGPQSPEPQLKKPKLPLFKHKDGRKRKAFRNAGYDSNGRLKQGYERVEDVDWGDFWG